MAWYGTHRLSAAIACASLVTVGACSGRNGDANRDTTSTAAAGGDVARDTAAAAMAPAGGAAGTTAGASTGTSAGMSAMTITGGDPEILQVLAAVDQGEVADGQMAERRARNAQVKAFARTLVSEHSQSLRQDRQLAKAANMQLNATGTMGKGDTASAAGTAGASGTSGSTGTEVVEQLRTMHQQTAERLGNMKGAAFDSAFVNAQVMGHQQVLAMLQGAEGRAQDANVKQHLTTAAQGVQKHLDRARELQQSLMRGDTGTSGDSTSKTRTGSDTGRKG